LVPEDGEAEEKGGTMNTELGREDDSSEEGCEVELSKTSAYIAVLSQLGVASLFHRNVVVVAFAVSSRFGCNKHDPMVGRPTRD
jgi:hypothetical protein